MRKLAHITPRYVVDRTAVAWWQHRFPDTPWLTAPAVTLLEQWLQPTDTIFEWGSGRSSLWFAVRGGRLVSVEHDRRWYSLVGDRLRAVRSADGQIQRHLVETSESDASEKRDEYVSRIDLFADGQIDLVLVDGLHRDRCAQRAVAKVRPGGLLVLDNADWYFTTGTRTPANRRGEKRWSSEWDAFEHGVKGWRRVNTTNGVWDTSIWIRPCAYTASDPPSSFR